MLERDPPQQSIAPISSARARQVRVAKYRNGQPVSSSTLSGTVSITTGITTIMDEDNVTAVNPIVGLIFLGGDSTTTDPTIGTDSIVSPDSDMMSDDSRNHLQDKQETKIGRTMTETMDPDTEDTSGYFDYNYSPPPELVVQSFDPTQYLHCLLSDLSSDNLNTLTTGNKQGQIRICSLIINGLTDAKLGLLLNYMALKSLDVLSLLDTRLSPSETNRLARGGRP